MSRRENAAVNLVGATAWAVFCTLTAWGPGAIEAFGLFLAGVTIGDLLFGGGK